MRKKSIPIIDKLENIYGRELVNPNVIRSCIRLLEEHLQQGLSSTTLVRGLVLIRYDKREREGYETKQVQRLIDKVFT